MEKLIKNAAPGKFNDDINKNNNTLSNNSIKNYWLNFHQHCP
jgi:hypothetical protein